MVYALVGYNQETKYFCSGQDQLSSREAQDGRRKVLVLRESELMMDGRGVQGHTDGTGCYQKWPQRRKGQTLEKTTQKDLQLMPVERVKRPTAGSDLHHNRRCKRIKSENMWAIIQWAKPPPGSSNHLFFIRLPVPSIYSYPAGSQWSASFVKTIIVEFPIGWIC